MIPRTCWMLLIALPVTLLVSGCQLRAGVGVRVDGDGGGALSVTLVTDSELREAATRVGADPLATLADAVEQLPDWDVRRPGAASPGRITLTTTFADPDELTRLSRELADALAAPEVRPLQPWRLVVDASTVELRGGAGLVLTSAVTDLGVARARADALLADSVQLRVTATMPGDVLESNADEVTGDGRVTWVIAPGETRELYAIARRPWTLERVIDTLAAPPGLASVLLVLVLGVGGGWLLVRRRRSRAGDGAAQAFAPSRSARIRARSLRT
ncbi:MAG TPA: hypothetical protein VFZ70_12990 [Euzebyales bacterium]